MTESAPGRPLGTDADSQIEYRAIEPWAIGGLVLGIVSSSALIAPVLWLIPPLGVIASAIALRRLRREPNRAGRTAALAGLGLSIFFGVVPPARLATAFVLLGGQARPVADRFFEYLREDSPEKAMMLRFAPDFRQPTDESLWLYYRSDNSAKAELRKFVRHPVVRTLLALGTKADVRFLRTAGMAADGAHGQVTFWYTVTYTDEQAKKKTFLVGIVLERKPVRKPGVSPWQVRDIFSDIDPRA